MATLGSLGTWPKTVFSVTGVETAVVDGDVDSVGTVNALADFATSGSSVKFVFCFLLGKHILRQRYEENQRGMLNSRLGIALISLIRHTC